MLLAKAKPDRIEILLSEASKDLHINHEKSVSVNDVLREHNEMKEEMKIPKNAVEYTI